MYADSSCAIDSSRKCIVTDLEDLKEVEVMDSQMVALHEVLHLLDSVATSLLCCLTCCDDACEIVH